MAVNIGLLGPVAIRDDGGYRSITAKRVRALLAVLALNPRIVVSFDELVDELWPDTLLNNPRNALHANALRLRKQLKTSSKDVSSCADEVLMTSGSGYVLNVPADAIDVGQFERFAADGPQLIKHRPREAVAVLEKATKLWRGPALADVGDGLRCRAAATRLNERRLSMQVDLVEARLEAGGDPGLIADLTEMVTRHPERERLSELLMLALYREGRQTEALGTFHTTRQWLISELGSEPTRSLRSMYQSILSHDAI
jgi:SARP family transcriptional regulator, regulator of embCAB operon